MKATIQSVEDRNTALISRIAILANCVGAINLSERDMNVRFHDAELAVIWDGGRLKFREGATTPYKFLKMIVQAGDDGINHEEVAEELYGDQCADVIKLLERVRKKIEQNRFPYEILNEQEKFYIAQIP